jgi:hypothetical protein
MNLLWLIAFKHRGDANLELLYHRVRTVKILDNNRIQIQVRNQNKAQNKKLRKFVFFTKVKKKTIRISKEIQKIFLKIFVKLLQIIWLTDPTISLTNGVSR